MAMVELIPLARCHSGRGTFVQFRGRELAVFRMTEPDRVFVIENACPHSSGNLSAGAVTDGIVTCPLHGWRFELASGRCTESLKAGVRTFPSAIRGESVWIEPPDGGG